MTSHRAPASVSYIGHSPVLTRARDINCGLSDRPRDSEGVEQCSDLPGCGVVKLFRQPTPSMRHFLSLPSANYNGSSLNRRTVRGQFSFIAGNYTFITLRSGHRLQQRFRRSSTADNRSTLSRHSTSAKFVFTRHPIRGVACFLRDCTITRSFVQKRTSVSTARRRRVTRIEVERDRPLLY